MAKKSPPPSPKNEKRKERCMQGRKKQIDRLINSAVATPKLPAQVPIRKPQQQHTRPNLTHVVQTPRLPTAKNPSVAQQQPLKPFRFLALPGELRNKIYGYLFSRELYEICWLDNKKSSLTYRLPRQPLSVIPKPDPSVGRRRRLLDYQRRRRSNESIPQYQLSPGPAAVLLTCKTINVEASSLFYGNSTFTFQCLGTFSKFLNTISVINKESIRSLHLKHHTAGNPFLTKDQRWKDKYDRKWGRLCWKAGDELRSLEELSLDLTINDVPIFFDQQETWMSPLFGFTDNGLKRCSIILRNAASKDTVLQVESYKLRKLLLGKNYKHGQKGESLWFQKQKEPVTYVGMFPVLHIRADKWPFQK